MPMNVFDPFPWRERGSRSFRVRSARGGRAGGLEFFDHESLFEDEVIRLKDQDVFVGRGISVKRMAASFFGACIALLCLLGRAGWMQVAQYDAYSKRADENRFRSVALPARRGIIRDRNGIVLAENEPSFDVRMRWSDLPRSEEDRAQTIATVARIAGMASEDILSVLHATGTGADEWVDVAKDISYERAIDLSVRLPELSGVTLVTSAKRRYPRSEETPSLSHVIGYVGSISPEEYEEQKSTGYRRTDEIGKTGVERSYESVICGSSGEIRTEVDAFGHFRAMVGEREPEDGNDVELTIDADLQEAAEEALKKGLELAKVRRGAVVVMDPRDGSLISAVSWPAYDNNTFAGKVSSTAYGALLADEDKPLFPRAWAGQFPSGSVIKPLIAAAALDEEVITPYTSVNSVGGISVGPWFFPDWSAAGHGITDVRRALAWSVNTFFYYIGGGYDSFHGLGVVRLSQWMREFGLGRALGLDVPGEADGFVPTREWKEEIKGERWYIGDTYNLSIGQGDLLVTPLQIARVTAAIANGGALVTPHVVRGDTVISDVLDVRPDVWETVRLGMRDAVTYGSARGLYGLPVAVAGKTGTAQWRSDRPNHAWFTGFAPYDKPEIVVTVLLEEGEEGSRYAVPVAADIFRAWADSAGRAY
jgi:penicillin-binding protein 2